MHIHFDIPYPKTLEDVQIHNLYKPEINTKSDYTWKDYAVILRVKFKKSSLGVVC